MTDRRKLQQFHPFARLNRLLDDVPPGDPKVAANGQPPGAPILLSVGEPQHRPPAFVAEELAKAAAGWGRYPPPRGTPEYCRACAAWLVRRYGLPEGMIDPASMILPLPGTREGLFFAALAATPADGAAPAGGGRPAVLLPNPFYHVYAGAAAAAGAEPVFVAATRETGFLPDYAGLAPGVLARATLCYFCSPSNPQGAAADLERLQALIVLARRYDFTVAFDECYAEIYTGTPPAGALQAAVALGGGLDNMLVFHSLSKRSSAPGLRCGFAVGEPDRIAALDGILRVGGAGVPLPVLAAGTRLWREDSHAAANRARYLDNFAVAERVLGNRFGFRKPAGAFFLWLDVGDGEAAALELWRAAGIRVLPGAYMCEAGADGANPGASYIRVALVYDAALTEAALDRIAEVL
ncbi:MAG: aminotransferase class I/II-fold pyridoxal phosphate-dependent enzyme [Kiloniellaceae bacterium]